MRIALLLTLLVPLAVAGCGSSDESSDTTTSTARSAAPADLDGRTFASTAVEGHELVPGTQVALRFDAGTLGAQAGCNSLSGGYAVEDGTLRWTAEPVQTMIGCEPSLQRQDEWLAELLTGGVEVAADGADGLTLTRGDVVLELREGAAPGAGTPPPIAGTTWRLKTIAGRDGTAASVPAGVRTPTLRIGEDGTAEVFAGCNRGSARATLRDDGFVVFGPLMLTRMACDEAAMRVEQAVTSVLDGRVALGFAGPDLSAAKNGRHLVFAAG
jgi:heat shock protein HslJ